MAEPDRSRTPARHPGPPRWPVVVATTGALYVLLGWLGMVSAVSPVQVSPLFPAAGVALVAVLLEGRMGLLGAALGGIFFHLSLGRVDGPWSAQLALALALTACSMVQAALGARLLRRHAGPELALSEPRDIAAFMLIAVLSGAVGAGLAVAVLISAGLVTLDQAGTTGLTWWAGDSLGCLLVAPVLLSLFGRPRDDWRPRRLVVGLSLSTLLLLLLLGTVQVRRLDTMRQESVFEREATSAAAALEFKLQEPLLALEALRSVFLASDTVTDDEMRRATQAWLQAPTHIQALGWSEWMPRNAVPAFEARVRAEGLTGYTVKDRSPSAGGTATGSREVVAIRFIEPLRSNLNALGVNALSVPQAADAIQRARQSGAAAATAGFRLSQDSATSRQTGVVVYRTVALRRPSAADNATRGVVFVTLRVDDLIRAAFERVPAELSICLMDHLGTQAVQRLAGAEGCETQAARVRHDVNLRFADRDWTLRIGRAAGAPPLSDSKAWLLSLGGMVLASMLGALLLGMTARTRRIEAAVTERTAALKEEAREREQAEAAMRESETRFRNIFNTVPIGVVYTDLGGRIQHVNPQLSTLTGYTANELIRMDVYDYLHPEEADAERHTIDRLLAGDWPMHRGHRRVVRKSGELVLVQMTLTLLRDRDGQPRRIVGVMEDITEHLRLVEAERAREQAESANQAKNEFLSRMSHELRTPLNAMLGFAQLLELDQRHPLAPTQRPWVAQIQQAGWHLLDMINDVLDLSRIESGNMRLSLDRLDLEALVKSSLALVERDAQHRALAIACHFDHRGAAAKGDSTRVRQVLINLLSNAVKYNRDNGRIDIETRVEGHQLQLTVRDTGLGMSTDQMADLFQPFNRLGREWSGTQGTGIGLVISQRLAELMGGRLHATSTPGAGSAFVLSLPLADEGDTVRAELDAAVTPNALYQQRVVHYVEDNETNIEVMRGMLAQRPQLRMTVSMTGRDALDAVQRQRPDVILLDMNLPDMDGLELLGHLKDNPLSADIAVVVVSADAMASQIEAAIAAGARRYVTKPVSVSELLRVLDDILHA